MNKVSWLPLHKNKPPLFIRFEYKQRKLLHEQVRYKDPYTGEKSSWIEYHGGFLIKSEYAHRFVSQGQGYGGPLHLQRFTPPKLGYNGPIILFDGPYLPKVLEYQDDFQYLLRSKEEQAMVCAALLDGCFGLGDHPTIEMFADWNNEKIETYEKMINYEMMK